MAAGLGFKDFTTGEVLTAGDVDGYLMQGVWVFASAAARTAAVPSPQEGNMSFLKDTNSTEYYSGAAWVAVAGGGGSGLTLIDEVSFSASMGVNVDSVFSTTYNNYKIIGNMKGDSFACDATMKLRVGGANTSTNYILQSLNSSSSTTTSSNNAAATDMLFGEVHTTYSIETYDIVAPFLTQRTSMMGMYGHSSNAMRMTYQAQTDATSFTGFALIFSAAATGTVSVYGYAKE